MTPAIRPYQNLHPKIGSGCFVDPGAVVLGEAVLENDVSVWPFAVIRADVNHIRIGSRSNIQDHAMLHVSHRTEAKPEGSPLVIGADVTVGHHVTLHGCTIHDRVLVGIGSIVLDDAVIESDTMIGAGSLVPPGKILAGGFLYMGSPVKQIRALSPEEIAFLPYSAAHYVRLANAHKANGNAAA